MSFYAKYDFWLTLWCKLYVARFLWWPDVRADLVGHPDKMCLQWIFVFEPYLKIYVSMCFYICFDFISWLCAYMFIWFMLVKILVFSKFSKHMILHIWKVFNLYLWPEFKNLFNYTIWNFKMILKILFEKIFLKLPISYLIFYVHHLFLKIAFFKRFSKNG